STSGTLIFAPGTTEQSFDVTILDDVLIEDDVETVRLRLSNPAGASIDVDTATISIFDDDGLGMTFAPDLSLALTSTAPTLLAGETVDVMMAYTVPGGPYAGAAQAISLTLTLPPELILETCSLACVDEGDGKVTVELGMGPPGSSGDVMLRLRASSNATGIAFIRAGISYQEQNGNSYTKQAWA